MRDQIDNNTNKFLNTQFSEMEIPRKRYALLVYSIVALVAVIIVLVDVFAIEQGYIKNYLVNISTELLGVFLIFLFVKRFFSLNEEDALNELVDYLGKRLRARHPVIIKEKDAKKEFNLYKLLHEADFFDYMGYFFPSEITDNDLFAKAVKERLKVRIISVNIESAAGRLILDHCQDPNYIGSHFGLMIHRLKVLNEKLKGKARGSLELRITTWLPSCELIIIKGKKMGEKALVILNQPAFRPPLVDRMAFIVYSSIDDLQSIEYYRKFFDSLWDEDSNEVSLDR